jgi:hypothetical protein
MRECANCKRELAGVTAPYGGIAVCGRADCLAVALRKAEQRRQRARSR